MVFVERQGRATGVQLDERTSCVYVISPPLMGPLQIFGSESLITGRMKVAIPHSFSLFFSLFSSNWGLGGGGKSS